MNINTDISNEESLLIGLCRLEFSSEQAGKLRTLVSGIKKWKYLADLANAHGVAALVYHNLEKLGIIQYVSQDVEDFLRNALMMSMSRNVYHLNEMNEVLKILNNAGIKTILLKGLALEITVYGNTGLRQMTDVDVLIRREDCLKARDLLIAKGFSSLPVKSPLHKIILTHTGKHLPSLIKNGFSVEIHHELFGSGKSSLTNMLYDKSVEYQINSERAFIPGAQIFFLYLVRHLFLHEKNNESQLRLYTDLVVLIEKFGDIIINTDLLLLAETGGMSNTLFCKLESLRNMWGMLFPGWLNELIDREHDQVNRDKFIFFLRSPKNNPVIDKAWLYRYNIREIPGIHRKLIYILGDLFPSISFMKKRYKCRNGWKALFYYPHRLGKLWYLIY
jgi:hypothetical protein